MEPLEPRGCNRSQSAANRPALEVRLVRRISTSVASAVSRVLYQSSIPREGAGDAVEDHGRRSVARSAEVLVDPLLEAVRPELKLPLGVSEFAIGR
jgi:hypothetical protein